ncbi:MAG TPA: glycoside hydrolase family 2 protein, partial [Candidatus Kryptobacter bacterium]|nr:glycoside hydrolase family 2 protein [Candidatus Kryptobacter bacterium]
NAVSGKLSGKQVRVSIRNSEDKWDFVFPLARDLRKDLLLTGAEPWWTHDHGEPNLYDVEVEILDERKAIVSKREFRTGFREVRLLRERDKIGESFIFELNGRKLFVKGADWIPADSFLPRVTGSDYRESVKAAREANMNMLRVWGGGVYEDEAFYEACDENGILVWQDFMFACASYPEYKEFMKEVEDEAEENVLRISNHPCTAVFCGNNESEWIWRTKTGRPVDEMPGAVIFKKKLRDIVRNIAPEIPYWRSSPFGGENPDSQSEGNHHQWEVWSAFKPPVEYLKNTARFVTEFGFQAPPSLATIREFTEPEDRHMQSEIMRLHNKQVEGTERLFRFLAGEVRIGKSFDDIVLQMQLVQAKAIKTGVEHWRTRKWDTAGTIYWQLNDCWPVSSWSAIDYHNRPKALYYWTKKFFKPIKVIITEENSRAHVFLVNDSVARMEGVIRVAVSDLLGNEIKTFKKQVRNSENSVKEVLSIPLSGMQEDKIYISASLTDRESGDSLDEEQYVCVPWLDFKFENPNVGIEISTEGKRQLIRLKSDRFVQGVYLPIGERVGELSDNFFSLVPGIDKIVIYDGSDLPEDFRPWYPLLTR